MGKLCQKGLGGYFTHLLLVRKCKERETWRKTVAIDQLTYSHATGTRVVVVVIAMIFITSLIHYLYPSKAQESYAFSL
jgi:hypothetical protein